MTKLRSCGAFKTPGRKIAVGLRHWVAGRSMKGTKQLFFRASRYSVHQFLQSFTALLTLFLLIPKALHKTVKGVKHGLSSLKSGEDGEPGRGVVVGALVAAKDAVLSIPSLIRSGFAAIQVQLYGFTHSFYHLLESIKHFFVGITGSFTSLQLSISHALEAIKSCIVGSLSSVNLFLAHVLEYLAGLWQSFKTGTSHTVDRLKLREKTWTAKVFAYFDDGKDYVSRVLTKVADAVKDFCHRLTSMFDRTPAISEAATPVMRGKELVGDGENHLVVKIKNTAITIQAKAADLVHGIQVGTVHMVHHVRDGIPRAKESVALFFKANLEKTKKAVIHGELFVKRKVHATRVATSMGLSAVGRSTMKFCKALASPFVYVIELPMKFMMSIYTAPLWTYMYVFGVCGGLSYLGFLSKTRYANETYSRKLKPSKKVRDGCQEFNLTDSTLRQCMEKMRAQIELGLNPATKEKSTVKCFNTYVQDLPTGREKGQFLALDLGGTNFRVLLITLNGRHFDMQSKIYVVPKDIMTGRGEALFDHIASCLESFALQHRVSNKNLPLGFTFSFPLNQVGLKSGFLTRWTKGFNCSDTVGEDVVKMLNHAIEKRKDVLKIDVVAILNDTTGTLMSCAWKNHNCKIGVILGTGSNACYVEKIQNVIGFDGDTTKPHVIVNTEWGAFGDNGELDFIKTPYDKEIDKNSVNPGKQIHEKMISGMYLGELARLLILKFVKDKILFKGQTPPEIQERWSFLTEYISDVESDPRGVFKQCRNVLGKVGILDPTDQDCSNIRYICECVSRRAAYLASAGVATLINKMDIPSVTVGVDGSLYRFHPHFHNLMHEKIPELCNSSIQAFMLMLSTDGSGRGAALVVSSVVREKPEH